MLCHVWQAFGARIMGRLEGAHMVTTTYASPLGDILLAADAHGLTGLWFKGQEHFASTLLKDDIENLVCTDAVSGSATAGSEQPQNGAAASVLRSAWAWLNAYFAGQEPAFTPPLHMIGTGFQREVWCALLAIPRGKTVSYGDIARDIERKHCLPGDPRAHVSPRAVGAAVARNPISIIVPCHRVVASDGSLNGYAGGLDCKAALLGLEGVELA